MDKWTDTISLIRQSILDESDDEIRRPVKLTKPQEKLKINLYKAWSILFSETYSPHQAAIIHSNRERIPVRKATKHIEAAIILFNDPFSANKSAEKAILKDIAYRNIRKAEESGNHAAVTKYMNILTKINGFDRPEQEVIDLTKHTLPDLVVLTKDESKVQELPDNYEMVWERLVLKSQEKAQLANETIDISNPNE